MPEDRAPIPCHHCGWNGVFFDLSLEAFPDLAQYSCPECDTHLVLVSYAPRPRSGAEDRSPRRITADPNARGTVRMTRMQGGADATPEERAREAKEIARRLMGGSSRPQNDEST